MKRQAALKLLYLLYFCISSVFGGRILVKRHEDHDHAHSIDEGAHHAHVHADGHIHGPAPRWTEVHKNSAWQTPHIRVFLWPNFTPHEKSVMREAFSEFKQKTCIEFREEDWVPWYHWKRWESESPYVIIRKSKRVNLLAESKLDEKLNRTLMYMSENSLNQPSDSLSRGIALHELGHILGLTHEHQRPDAIKYITVAASSELSHDTAIISHEHASEDELVWPFDPMSVTIYTPTENAKYHFSLTPLCSDVKQSEIGKGKIEGRLTYWDAVKINSLYCPDQIKVNVGRVVIRHRLSRDNIAFAVLKRDTSYNPYSEWCIMNLPNVAFDANRRAPPCQGSKKAKFLDVPRSVRRGNSMSRGRTKN